MAKKKKILVIIDTNQIGRYTNRKLNCENYFYLEINSSLHQEIINYYKDYSSTVHIDLAVPEIVLEELKMQQISRFKSDFEKLKNLAKKFKDFEGFEIKLPNLDYQSHISSKGDAYMGTYGIIRLETPKDTETFKKIISKSLRKEKPFYKKGKSDSGFKDSLIWESIIKFVEINNNYDKYFFLTEDSDFDDTNLNNEFCNKTEGNPLEIIMETSSLKSRLEQEITGSDELNRDILEIEEKIGSQLINYFDNYNPYISYIGDYFSFSDLINHKILDIWKTEGGYRLMIGITAGGINISNSDQELLEIEVYLEVDKNHDLLEETVEIN